MGPKMLPKSIQNLTFGARGPNLFDFRRILRSLIFDDVFYSFLGRSSPRNADFGSHSGSQGFNGFPTGHPNRDPTGTQPGPSGEFGGLCWEGLGRVSGIVFYIYRQDIRSSTDNRQDSNTLDRSERVGGLLKTIHFISFNSLITT